MGSRTRKTFVEEWGCFAENLRAAKSRAVDYLYLTGKIHLWPAFIKDSQLTNNSPEESK